MSGCRLTATVLAALLALAGCDEETEPEPEQETKQETESALAPQSAPIPPERPDPVDVACLAEAVYFEARGTGRQGTQAVAHVVVNRARDTRFPDTVCSVIQEDCQFEYRCDGKSEQMLEVEARDDAQKTAFRVLGGAIDITGGALFFHAKSMPPGWFNTRDRVGQFGGNIFYR